MHNRDRDEESSIRTDRDNLICSPFFSFVIIVGLSGKKKAFKQNLNRNGRRARVITYKGSRPQERKTLLY